MQLVYDQHILEWASDVIGFPFRDDAKVIGASFDGDLRAVVVYDGFSECDCNMHIASDGSARWLSRGFLRAVFAYPFIQLGLRRVTGLVPAKNERALNFDLRLGFEHEGLCRDALPDDDIIVLGMRRSVCPYIPEEYRHARSSSRPDHPGHRMAG